MRQIGRTTALGLMFVATGVAVIASEAVRQEARAQAVVDIKARIVAINIPGASAIAQIGPFVKGGTLSPGNNCTNPSPIPTKFPGSTLPRNVLDPNRILVASSSNFGASLATGVGQQGSFLSIDPTGMAF
jgi:hypothetical protein